MISPADLEAVLLYAYLGFVALLVAYAIGREHERRCLQVNIGTLDATYRRGIEDERARRDEEIRRLDRWVAR